MLLKPVLWISFDLDNTLWRSDAALKIANQGMLEDLKTLCPNCTYLNEDWWLQAKDKVIADVPNIQVSELRRRVLYDFLNEQGLSNTDTLVEELFQKFFEARQNVEFFDDAHNVLDQLTQKYSLIAITNGNACPRTTGIDRWLHQVIAADEVGLAKPHAAPFMQALSIMGCEPQQVLHVGDHPIDDVLGAQQVGMQTAWMNHDNKPWQYEHQPTIAIQSLSELLTFI